MDWLIAFAIDTAVVVASVRLFSKKVDALVPATVWLVASVLADALITLSLYVSLVSNCPQWKASFAKQYL